MNPILLNKNIVFDMNGFAFRWCKNQSDFFTDLLQSVFSISRSFKAKNTYFVFDYFGSDYRKEFYPEYKSNRDRSELEHFYNQLDKTYYYLQQQKEKVMRFKGIEADDIIAFISLNIDDVIVLSEDRDLLQLPSTQYSLRKHKIISLKEEYGCNSPEFILAKAIGGDTGDNVIGLQNLGIKTALKIIKQCNLEQSHIIKGTYDLDIFYERVDRIKRGKRIERILENREIIERNLKLVDLITYNDEIIEDIREDLHSILNQQ